MKRIMVYLLTMTTLCAFLSACRGRQPDSQPPDSSGETAALISLPKEEYNEIASRLLDDWYRYLIRCENLYGGMRWSLSYLDPFFEDHSWVSLQIARTALSSAKSIAEGVAEQPWEEKMTVEDYDKLVQAGADVSGFTAMSSQLQILSHDVLLVYRDYQDKLNSPIDAVFLTYTLETFEDWAHIQQQFYDLVLRNLAVETDYLLSCLDSEEMEALFIESIAKNCPQINALRKENPQDPDALLDLLAELPNEITELDLNSVYGQFGANYHLEVDKPQPDTAEGMESVRRHAQAMAADMVDDLAGFPTALPYPSWWYASDPGSADSVQFYYYYNEPTYGEDQSSNFVMPNDTIISPPDCFIVTWTGVSLEDYLLYVRYLERMYHISAQSSTKKDGVYIATYEVRSDAFAIIWEEEEVSIQTQEGSVCFGPVWYAYYTNNLAS